MPGRKLVAEPVRVLHVLGDLGRGGAETWAFQLFGEMDPSRVRLEFLVHGLAGHYKERLLSLGARIHYPGNPRHPLRYTRALQELLRLQGPFLAVHSHVGYFSGCIVRTARRVGIPGRIVHARNSSDGCRGTPYRILYRRLMRQWMLVHSTALMAVSREAALGLFGPAGGDPSRCRILTGLDFSPFSSVERSGRIRRELKIPNGAPLVGHVGSFRRQKNHAWFVEVAKVLAARLPEVFFLAVGEGGLRPQIEKAVKSANLEARFRFAGERGDIPAVLAEMDAFLFPSFHEGMPRALLEAQAAGLPCVASDVISADSGAVPEAVTFLSLEVPAATWALAVEKALRLGRSPEVGQRAVQQFAARGLTIEGNARILTEFYEDLAHAQRC